MTERKIDWDFFEYVIALNCTLNETYLATVVDVLKLEYVKNPNVRMYLGIIFEYYREHSVVPNATEIKARLTTDDLKKAYKDVVIQFKTLDSTYNQDELLLNTEQFIKERGVYHAVKSLVNQISDENKMPDTSETLQLFENACNVSLIDNLGHDYFNEVDKHIAELTVVDRYIPTGYKWLDKMLGGGWAQNGRALYLFTGETNIGKSIVIGNLAGKVVEQCRAAVIITLEMPESLYAKRIDCQLSRIPFSKLKEESDMLSKFLKGYTKDHPGARLIFKEFPPSTITPNHIKAYLQKLITKKKIKPDVVFIDYLTLLEAVTPTGSLYADGKAVAEHVRALSYPFSCPFVSAAQLNRSGYDTASPGLKTMGESMAIPHTADAMFSLWCSEAEKELGILNVGMMKSRFGPNFGKQAFKIDYDTLAIDEMDDAFTSTDQVQEVDNILERLEGESKGK